jgi:hypothetical protein
MTKNNLKTTNNTITINKLSNKLNNNQNKSNNKQDYTANNILNVMNTHKIIINGMHNTKIINF